MPNGPPVQVCATSVGSELSRQIPVDLEADADLNEGWGCPGHVRAVAQEGYYGAGHDKLHQGFYSQLRRNDGGSCCNLMDCRPTQSRIVGDHYEVKVTVFGRLFPTTRSITWSRPMVALTSALRDRWVRTRALYSVSFCLQRADGSMGRVANA